MTKNSLSNNIVILFRENVANTLRTDPIESKIADIYSSKNPQPQPVITKFPNQVAIMLPQLQTSVVVTGRSLIVTDQTVGNFTRKDNLNFIKLTHGIWDTISKPIIAYGFNFDYELENSSFPNLIGPLQGKFFLPTLVLPPEADLKYAIPKLVVTKNGVKISFAFEVQINTEDSEEINKLALSANCHMQAPELPVIDDLYNNYLNSQEYISEYVDSIFRPQ